MVAKCPSRCANTAPRASALHTTTRPLPPRGTNGRFVPVIRLTSRQPAAAVRGSGRAGSRLRQASRARPTSRRALEIALADMKAFDPPRRIRNWPAFRHQCARIGLSHWVGIRRSRRMTPAGCRTRSICSPRGQCPAVDHSAQPDRLGRNCAQASRRCPWIARASSFPAVSIAAADGPCRAHMPILERVGQGSRAVCQI